MSRQGYLARQAGVHRVGYIRKSKVNSGWRVRVGNINFAYGQAKRKARKKTCLSSQIKDSHATKFRRLKGEIDGRLVRGKLIPNLLASLAVERIG